MLTTRGIEASRLCSAKQTKRDHYQLPRKTEELNRKVCYPVVLGQQHKAAVCIYLYIHTVMNTTILQLVAIYNIQIHVSALYVGHHQVVQRTY